MAPFIYKTETAVPGAHTEKPAASEEGRLFLRLCQFQGRRGFRDLRKFALWTQWPELSHNPYASTREARDNLHYFASLLEAASAPRGREQLFVGPRDSIRSLKASSGASMPECEAWYLGTNHLKLPLLRAAEPVEHISNSLRNALFRSIQV